MHEDVVDIRNWHIFCEVYFIVHKKNIISNKCRAQIKYGTNILAQSKNIWRIINIVDEILHILIGLGIIGGEGLQLRNALSRKEQNFLAELTQLSMLHRATKAIRNDESDEE